MPQHVQPTFQDGDVLLARGREAGCPPGHHVGDGQIDPGWLGPAAWGWSARWTDGGRGASQGAEATGWPGACQPASVPVSTGMQAPLIADPPAPARNVISAATSVVSTNRLAGCSAIMLAITPSGLIPRRRVWSRIWFSASGVRIQPGA